MEERFSSQEVEMWAQKVSKAAKDGDLEETKLLLSNLSSKLLKEILDCNSSENSYRSTPLTIAAIHGHLEVVKLLISHLIADLDKTGTDDFLSRFCERPLKVAAERGHLNIVEWLVNRGCDVNQDSDGSGTPLVYAYHKNQLEVVKYLVDVGADIDATDEKGYTCLMESCFLRREDLVQYLLEKGADVNWKTDDGQTALHEAAIRDIPRLVELLLQHGATLSENNAGLSPVIVAALWGCYNVVDFFVESLPVCRKEKINMLELIGGTLANKDLNVAFRYLRQAMVERHKDPSEIISKPHWPLLTLSGIAESRTLEELESRQFDEDILRLEGLTTLQRILGTESPHYIKEVYNSFVILNQRDRTTEAITLLFHGLKYSPLSGMMKRRIRTELIYILERFEKKLEQGECLGLSCVVNCLELTFLTMQQDQEDLTLFPGENERGVKDCLHWIVVGLKVAQGQEEGKLLQKQAKRLTGLSLPTPLGRSVLHLAVTCCWYKSFLWGREVDLPYDLLVSFLLQCGADIHARDEYKNTPLHLIADLSPGEESQCEMLDCITRTLLKAGALVGVQNSRGKTPLDVAATEAVAALLRQHVPVSLKSLAATAVVKHQLPYAGEIPKELEEFVQCH